MMKFIRPFGPAMTAPHLTDALRAAGGAAAGLLLCEAVLHLLGAADGSGHLLLIAPFGASAFLIFVVPNSPLAQPWSAVIGNTVSALAALAVIAVTPTPLIAAPAAIALSILTMAALRAFHPPGGAVALATVLAHPAPDFPGLTFAATPVAAGTIALVAGGILWHRFSGRRYPFRQPEQGQRAPAPSPQELANLLDRLRLAPNIGPGDLARLLTETENTALHLDDLTAATLMSRALVTIPPDAPLSQMVDLFRAHRFKTLPVIDASGHYLGVVDQSALLGQVDPLLTATDLALSVDPLPATARLPTVLDQLEKGHPQAVPIVQDSRLIGLITRSDLIALLATRLRNG